MKELSTYDDVMSAQPVQPTPMPAGWEKRSAIKEARGEHSRLLARLGEARNALRVLKKEAREAAESDRVTLATAMAHGEPDPGRPAGENVSVKLTAAEREIGGLLDAIELAACAVNATFTEDRAKWAENQREAYLALERQSRDLCAALRECIVRLPSEAQMLGELEGVKRKRPLPMSGGAAYQPAVLLDILKGYLDTPDTGNAKAPPGDPRNTSETSETPSYAPSAAEAAARTRQFMAGLPGYAG